MSKDPDSPADFWLKYRPIPSPSKSLFYRYENEGIIVYDSSARISDELTQPTSPFPDLPKPRKKLDVMDGDEYDILQYINMKHYSQFRFFPQNYTLVIPEDSLRFSSKFESGNLKKAIKLNDTEYNLFLEHDTETLGYTQWFYFSVQNRSINTSVRFNIMNFVKYDSLFSKGMKPLVFSEKQKDRGWTRDCTAVAYYKNTFPRINNKFFYTLTFSYVFKDLDDQVFFAYSFPYTYSDLQIDLEKFKLTEFSGFVRVNNLCHTLSGNTVPVLTVTKNVKKYTPWEEELEKLKKSAAGRKALRVKVSRDKEKAQNNDFKRCIFLTARVHPGETNGSYMMKGFLKFITGNSAEARLLRKNFVFKIIPMLNPDGVVYGNYRCSLLGVDLNRRWTKPNKIMHPEIYYTKRLIQMLSEEKEISLFCDMHGHSIKKDVFVYGCRDLDNPKQDMLIKIIPFLLSKQNKAFSFKKSIFHVAKDKTSTGRVVCFQDLHIINSYTLEASFFGPACKSAFNNKDPESADINLDKHFEKSDFERIGKDFGKVLVMITAPREFNRLIKKLCTNNEQKFVTDRVETEEYELTGEEALSSPIKFSSFGSFIEENVIDELCLSEGSNSGDCSDSEGSENDDKRILFNKEKKVKGRKVKMGGQRSAELEKEKVLRNTVTGEKRKGKSGKSDDLRNYCGSSGRNKKEFVRELYSSNQGSGKNLEIQKANEQKLRPTLKFAVAVMLPKESTLFKGKDPQHPRTLPDRRARPERYKRPEINPAIIKFKQVTMFAEDKKNLNDFKYII